MAHRLGVAFGGGGARGLAHIGVIRTLRSAGFLPSLVAGTSAGSIAAVLYAAGLEQERMEELASHFDWFRHVIKLSDTIRRPPGPGRRAGLLSNRGLGDTVNDLVGHRSFDELPVEVAVVATDLERRARVIFCPARTAQRLRRRELERFLPPPRSGLPGCETVVVSDLDDVGLAVRSSCAVPGIFLPVEIRGMRLVDGGIMDQVPVDVVRAMGASFSIGVSLAMGWAPERISRPAEAIAAMVAAMGVHSLRGSLELADIGFQIPGIEARSLVDPRQRDLVELGAAEMAERLAAAAKKLPRRPRGSVTGAQR